MRPRVCRLIIHAEKIRLFALLPHCHLSIRWRSFCKTCRLLEKKTVWKTILTMEKYFSREFELSSSNVNLEFLQHTVGDVGCVVWDAALVLAGYLDRMNQVGQKTLKGLKILELGSGTGCVGLVAAALGYLHLSNFCIDLIMIACLSTGEIVWWQTYMKLFLWLREIYLKTHLHCLVWLVPKHLNGALTSLVWFPTAVRVFMLYWLLTAYTTKRLFLILLLRQSEILYSQNVSVFRCFLKNNWGLEHPFKWRKENRDLCILWRERKWRKRKVNRWVYGENQENLLYFKSVIRRLPRRFQMRGYTYF